MINTRVGLKQDEVVASQSDTRCGSLWAEDTSTDHPATTQIVGHRLTQPVTISK